MMHILSCTSGFSSSHRLEPEPFILLGRVMQGSIYLSWLSSLLTKTKIVPFPSILEEYCLVILKHLMLRTGRV
nr:hypothetical protein Iba_scaffold7504CG0010 [Ipomoea batatas]